MPLRGELVRTWTADGLELCGLLCDPTGRPRGVAVLHIHGATSNFYRSHSVGPIGDELTGRGFTFLTANTRGHDIVNILRTRDPLQGARMGNAYERFEDCVHDIAAWLGLLEARGWSRIVLEGHSYGAMKAAYYLGQEPDPRVIALSLLSPGERGYFARVLAREFAEARRQAEELVAQGRGEQLVLVEGLTPLGARRLLEGFMDGGGTGVFDFRNPAHPWTEISQIQVPMLILFGTEMEPISVPAELAVAIVKAKAVRSPRRDTRVIAGAPHNYRGFEGIVARVIGEWLETVV